MLELELCEPNLELDSTACELQLREELCRSFSAVDGCTRYRVEAVLPAFLSPSLWRRHGFSLADIKSTLASFPAGQLWLLLLSLNLSSGKSQSCNSLREKLLAHFAGQSEQGSVLGARSVSHSHTPAVPRHLVDSDMWQSVRSQKALVKVKNSACYYAPLALENGCLLMGRVVPLDVFRNVYVNLRELPAVVPPGLAVLEEAFLLAPEP